MKLYILRWNPSISVPYDKMMYETRQVRQGAVEDFNWSVYDFEELEEGDAFLLCQVSSGEQDGIVALGTFISDPYTSGNWKRKDGTNLFYADMNIDFMLDRRKESVLNAADLEKVVPELDWHGGHSGVLVEEVVAEKLIIYLTSVALPLSTKAPTLTFAFNSLLDGKYHLTTPLARYLNGLCPKFKQAVIQSHNLSYENFKEGETIDTSLIEIGSDRHNDIELSSPSSVEELIKFFVPVA